MTEKELECVHCGFCTYDYQDMVEHLAQIQEYPEENCDVKSVKVRSGGKQNG